MPPTPSAAEIERTLLSEIASMIPDAPSEFTAATPLHTLGLDSLRLFEVFVLVEKQFGVALLDAPLKREYLENTAALATHIAERMSEK